MNTRQRLFRTLILCAIGLCLGGVIAGLSIMAAPSAQNTPPRVMASSVGGAFSLVDQDGKPRSDKDFAQNYKLIYFGFAYCPVICPTELQKMAQALKSLPDAVQAQVQPIFITIDPERDTPKDLKDYVALFDKRMIGLTGSQAQINDVKKTYKVYAAKVPAENGAKDEYTMDHSSYIYFMTPDDQLAKIFKTEDSAAKVADGIKEFFPGVK